MANSRWTLISTALIWELDYDTLCALAGVADTVVREYLQAYSQPTEAVIRLFRAAQRRGFED